jgi:endonuclease YncB( thermonuclease family)
VIRFVALLALLASISCAARIPRCGGFPIVEPPAFEHLDECPNPTTESMAWMLVSGTVVEVTAARSFRLQTAQGVVTVSLPNVGEPYDAGAREALQRMIVGKKVSVMRNPSADGNDITGEVLDADGQDVSRRMLRSGAASYASEPVYTLSDYVECLHRIAEREAKADRLGIWH